jgi:hypothetical protein
VISDGRASGDTYDSMFFYNVCPSVHMSISLKLGNAFIIAFYLVMIRVVYIFRLVMI